MGFDVSVKARDKIIALKGSFQKYEFHYWQIIEFHLLTLTAAGPKLYGRLRVTDLEARCK